VLEIEDVGDDADKAFFMGIILMRLAEHLRVNRDSTASTELRHLTVVEEAHRLLRRPEPGAVGPAAHAVEMFAAMLAEVRAYGEGLIVAEQIPSKLIPDVIKNTAVKIVHRLPAQDDRESVGATMNLDERQSKYLVTLRRGDGAVFTDGMDRPVLIRIPDGTTLEDGPANTAPVAGIIEWRSLSCGRECQAEPCTLRQMRTAQHVVGTETWLGIWAELTVVAHLCGSPMPRPDKAVLDTLVQQGHSGRTLDCAISHAVDDAVAVRSTVLQPLVSPIDLAVHASGAMRAVLAGASDPCADDALAFLSTPLRWERVRLALAAARDTVGRHPRTEEWQTQFRRMIPGDSCLEQLIAVACFLAEEMQDRERLDAMTFGARRPSTLEHLMGGFGDGWTGRVLAQLESFEPAKWPLYYLTPQSEPDDEGGSDE
jgi:hypothetical protein